MTFTPAHKPGGAPDGGQFTAPAHSDAVPALPATSEEDQHRAFWEKAQADSLARQERIRQHEADRLARMAGHAGQEPVPEPIEYIPETTPPVRKGFFSRAFAAVESFATSVELGHQRDMEEIASLSREARIDRRKMKPGD